MSGASLPLNWVNKANPGGGSSARLGEILLVFEFGLVKRAARVKHTLSMIGTGLSGSSTVRTTDRVAAPIARTSIMTWVTHGESGSLSAWVARLACVFTCV